MGSHGTRGGIAALAALLAMVALPARAAFDLDPAATEVVFAWSPAGGPVEGYYVYLSVNDSEPVLDHATPEPRSRAIPGIPGDRIRVQVVAFDADGNLGPPSQVSEFVVFADPPPDDPPPDVDPPSDPPDVDPPDDPPDVDPPSDPPDVDPPSDPPDDDPRNDDRTAGSSDDLERSYRGDGEFDRENARLKVELENLGVEPAAKASLLFKLDQRNAFLVLRARKLAPETEYELRLDGALQAVVATDRRGALALRLDALGRREQLWFDPRGHVVSLADEQGDVLSATISRPGEPQRSLVLERSKLDGPSGEARLLYLVKPNGLRRFLVSLRRTEPDSRYRIFVDGKAVGRIDTNRKGAGKLVLLDTRALDDLDFDPRGAWIEIKSGGRVAFDGGVEAELPGFSICTPDSVLVALEPTGSSGGEAYADLEVDDECRVLLRVELSGVANGTYVVAIGERPGGSVRTGGGEGMLELESAPDDADEMPLPADPRVNPISVESRGVVVFSE